MMGTKARSFAPLCNRSIEDLVPPDNFYRHLESKLDLGFVRDLVRSTYRECGRPSVDPRVFFFEASATDPDAALMALKKGGLHFGYHDHYAVDGGKARIILEVLVTPADVMENQPFLDMLWRSCFRWQLRPDQVTGDTTYGTVENIVDVKDQQIHAYVPLPDFDQRTPFYGASRFTYDPERDEFRCPEGQVLRRKTAKYTEGVVVYQAEAATCNACPLKAACTESSQGRQVRRSLAAEYLDRVRAYHETAAYEKAMAKRNVGVEPLFGEAKDWHGLRWAWRLSAMTTWPCRRVGARTWRTYTPRSGRSSSRHRTAAGGRRLRGAGMRPRSCSRRD